MTREDSSPHLWRTARQPNVPVVMAGALVLGVAAALASSLASAGLGTNTASLVGRWLLSNGAGVTGTVAGAWLAARYLPPSWFNEGSLTKRLGVSYLAYGVAGLLGGLARLALMWAVELRDPAASIEQDVAYVGPLIVATLMLGIVANLYVGSVERIHAQRRALVDQVRALDEEVRVRQAAEEALRESEDRFRSTAESSGDAVVVFNSTGQVLFWNSGAERIFGFDRSEITGERPDWLLPERLRPEYVEGLLPQITQPSANSQSTFDIVGVRSDGTEFPLEASVSAWQRASSSTV